MSRVPTFPIDPRVTCLGCGAALPVASPRGHQKCGECGRGQWDNPLPVLVMIQPIITHSGHFGVVGIRRGIEPCVGGLALPGGYLEQEEWSHAASREMHEETGIEVPASCWSVWRVVSTKTGKLPIFVLSRIAIQEKKLPPFVCHTNGRNGAPETTERHIFCEPQPLCFSSHTDALADFFRTHH